MNILKTIKAVAEETRLRLTHLLIHYEFNVNEIASVMEMGQPRISRHLKILTESGLLTSRRDGSFVYYQTIRDDKTRYLLDFINQTNSQPQFTRDLDRAQTVLKERKNRTRQFFNAVAEEWDHLKQDVFGNFDFGAVISGRLTFCETAVDLGCGTGELMAALRKKAGLIIGVDSSARMLELARQRLSPEDETFNLRLGEMEHLPLKDRETDAAVINMVLHYLPLPESGIREAARVLKPNGQLIVTELDKHHQESIRKTFGGPWLGFEADEIGRWLGEAGFRITETEQFSVNYGLTINLFVAQKKEQP